MEGDTCAICGGDGRISNSFGRTTSCPGCHGSGRRSDDGPAFRDVTKTKPSHHRPQQTKAEATGKPWPTTFEGGRLATEIEASATCANETKARLVREIIEYEGTHGRCTQTLIKKIRKQLKPPTSN